MTLNDLQCLSKIVSWALVCSYYDDVTAYYWCCRWAADTATLGVFWRRFRPLVAMATSTTTTMAGEVWSERITTADDCCPVENLQREPRPAVMTSIVRLIWKSRSAWTRNWKDRIHTMWNAIPYPVNTFTATTGLLVVIVIIHCV